jgi:hypothetical protein
MINQSEHATHATDRLVPLEAAGAATSIVAGGTPATIDFDYSSYLNIREYMIQFNQKIS